MVWNPPVRPSWVDAVNSGDVALITDEAAPAFDRDDLLAEARARLGRDAPVTSVFGEDSFVEPLDVLVRALEEEAGLTVLGRWITRRFLLRILMVRAQIVSYVESDPGVRHEPIAEPVFLTGAPRTGTTVLHALMALHRDARAPEGWELLRPVPPPEPAAFPDPARVALADRELRMPALIASGMDAIHTYGGRMLKECVSSMSFALRSEEFTARYDVPSYNEWLRACELRPAYEWHRLVLQILQRRLGGSRWVLKSPVHLHSLPTLLSVFPDARIVCTHRDPVAVLASVTSLVATLRHVHSDHVDFPAIGRYHADLYGCSLDRLVDLVDGEVVERDRLHHVPFVDLVDRPVETVADLARRLGWPTEEDTRRAMADHLDRHPRGEKGEHGYAFADLQIDEDDVRRRSARYQRRFAVVQEHVP